MNKREFVEKFRSALSGQVSAYIIEENVRYYEEYIDMQIRQGKTEQEVLYSLGDPRLLAKTVITANKTTADTDAEYTKQTHDEKTYANRDAGKGGFMNWYLKLPSWLRSILTTIILIGVFFIIAKVIGLILPFLLLICIVVYIARMFRGSRW